MVGNQAHQWRLLGEEYLAHVRDYEYFCGMSLSALYFHLVIRTKNGDMTISEAAKCDLYAYMAGIITKRGCRAVVINDTPNHIHFLINVSPSTCFSDLVHDLQLGATHCIKTHRESFIKFNGWGREFAVFSCSASDRSRIISYIKNQKTHHRTISAEDELCSFCDMAQIDYYQT
ncbi:MAG: transposase [Muribaculaceae bacterium]|nr:transposase [Muribaculaceae bacterium]